MRPTACSWRCGWCGRCSEAWEGNPRDDDDLLRDVCDTCGEAIGLYGRITISGVGQFCSRICANAGTAKHEARMLRPRA